MKIYVASSWKNDYQRCLVDALRAEGHQVYDFRNPAPDSDGFSWSSVTTIPIEQWSFAQYMSVLDHPYACRGFRYDMDALQWCDACVLALPCGRSSHLELGWAVGKGKLTAILHDGNIEPELMSKMVDAQFQDSGPLINWLAGRTL